MKKSEELSRINELTLKNLFHDSMGLNVEMCTYDNPLKGKWVIYERLKIIAPRFPSPDIMKFVMSQYDTRGGFHKILIRKLARIGFLHSMGLLASKSMDIDGIDSLGKNMIFWWRGRSMRLFDFSTGTVTCTLKEGLPKHLFVNSVSFRQKYKYPFLVDLLDSGETWFREVILSGRTLGQVKNKTVYEKLINDTINSMKQISCDTITYKNHKEYTNQLRDEIMEKLSVCEKEKLITKIKILNSLVDKLCLKAEKLDKPVPIVLSHSDLHPSNIWVDNNQQISIIDWEANSFKSIWYDPATLLCKFRRSEGRRRMLLNCNDSSVIDAVLINDEQKKYNMESVMAILLLENIIEIINILLDFPQENRLLLDGFTENLEKINWF